MKTFALAFLLALSSFTGSKLVKTKVADGISVSVSEELYPMTPEDIAQRFPSVRAPLGAFTNLGRVVDFSINTSATKWPDGDVVMAQQFFKDQIVPGRTDVLNGIAYDSSSKRLFITGKRWPKMFEVRLN